MTPTGSAASESFLRSFAGVPDVPVRRGGCVILSPPRTTGVRWNHGRRPPSVGQAARWAVWTSSKSSAVFDDCATFCMRTFTCQDQTWDRVFRSAPFEVKQYIKSFVARSIDEFRPHVGSDEAWFEAPRWLLRGAFSVYGRNITSTTF